MRQNFRKRITYDGKVVQAAIVPEFRNDGVYYEVNVKGFPRFYMSWSNLGRFDIVPEEGVDLPYNLVLAVSDAIEEQEKKV